MKKVIFILLIAQMSLAQTSNSTSASAAAADRDKLIKKSSDASRGAKIKDLKKKESALPDTKMSFAAEKQETVDIKPPESSKLLVIENREQADYEKALDKQIKELYELTIRFKDRENRGDIWLRLAELYIEKANLVEDRIQTDFDVKLEQYQSAKIDKLPLLDLSEVREYNNKSIQLYEMFIKEFPKHEGRDQALFYLAYEYDEVEKPEKAFATYTKLVNEFPSSRFSIEARFAIAEYNFDKEKWAEALKNYSHILKNPENSLYKISLYKSGWCYFRSGALTEAIQSLDQIVQSENKPSSEVANTGRYVDSIRLGQEAAKDLILFYAETSDMKKAIDYFKSLNQQDWPESLVKLAYRMSGKGYYSNSREVFKYLISLNETSPRNFDFQLQIVKDFFFAKNAKEFKDELYLWVEIYGKDSIWHNKNSDQVDLIKKSYDVREQTLRNYILQQHQTAQNSRGTESRTAAKEGYDTYFRHFDQSANAHEMHFYYGELLYDMQQFEAAMLQYQTVALKYPKSKHFETAAQNWLIASERLLPDDAALQKQSEGSITPIPLNREIAAYMEAAEFFRKNFEKNEKIPEVRFRQGRLYYLTNNFNESEAIFKEIVLVYPKTKVSEYSANLLLDIYNLKKDYAGLEKVGQALLLDQAIANTKLGDDIKGVVEKAGFVKAQSLEQTSNFAGAAGLYENFVTTNPRSVLVLAALFNAGVNHEKSGNRVKALASYEKALATVGADPDNLKLQTKKLLVKLYQETAQFEKAAPLYVELAKESSVKDPLTKNYIYNAGLMAEVTGKPEAAIDYYTQYRSNITDEDERAELLFKIAELGRKNGQTLRAIKNYEQYQTLKAAKPLKKIQSIYWQYKLENKTFNPQALKQAVLKIEKGIKNLPSENSEEANTLLAALNFESVNQDFSHFISLKMPEKAEKQKKYIESKLEHLNKLNEKLEAVIKINSAEEIVSSLNLSARANLDMYEAFSKAALPEGLDEENLKLYKEEVAKLALPFKEKSLESHKLAVSRGRSLLVYNTAYADSLDYLVKNNVAGFTKVSAPLDLKFELSWVDLEKDKSMTPLKTAIVKRDLTQIRSEGIEALKQNPDDTLATHAMANWFWLNDQKQAALYLNQRALLSDSSFKSNVESNVSLATLEENQHIGLRMLAEINNSSKRDVTAARNLALVSYNNSDPGRAAAELSSFAKQKTFPSDAKAIFEAANKSVTLK